MSVLHSVLNLDDFPGVCGRGVVRVVGRLTFCLIGHTYHIFNKLLFIMINSIHFDIWYKKKKYYLFIFFFLINIMQWSFFISYKSNCLFNELLRWVFFAFYTYFHMIYQCVLSHPIWMSWHNSNHRTEWSFNRSNANWYA